MRINRRFLPIVLLVLGLSAATSSHAQISNNVISGAQTICVGAQPQAVFGPTAVANCCLTYQWQVSTSSATSGFSNIVSANDTLYQPGTLSVTSWFRRIANDLVSTDTSNPVAITVLNYPVAAFSVNNAQQCLSGNQFSFTNQTTTGGQTLNYYWSFGDQKDDTAANPSHQYLSPGTYNVRLKAMNGFGCNDSVALDVSVYFNPKAVIISPSQTSFCGSGQQLTIYADSSLGDYHRNKLVIIYDATRGQSGLTGASKVYMHSGLSQSNAPGSSWSHVVGNWGQDDGVGEMTSLGNDKWRIAIDVHKYYGLGINDSVKFLAMVFRSADGTATGKDNLGNDIFMNAGNNTLQVSFNGVKGNYQQSYQWFKNNVALTGETSSSLKVDSSGDYVLEVDGHLGCLERSSAQSISFNPLVNLKVGINQQAACFNSQNLSLYDSSSLISGTYTRLWDFGDGNTDTAAFPVHQYAQYGSYKLYVYLTTDKGCQVKDSFEYQLSPSVNAGIYTLPSSKACGTGASITLVADSSQIGYRTHKLIIHYDATSGQSGLTGASKVYMHAGLANSSVPGSSWTNVVGNWGQDDGVGEMTSLGNDKWQIALDVDRYFGIDPRQSPNYLAFVFRNADGTATGKDSSGNDIFISLQSTTPAATFIGVVPGYEQTYYWYRNDTLISTGVNAYTTQVSGSYKLQVDGGIGCATFSKPVQLVIGPKPIAKPYAVNINQCSKDNQFHFSDSSSITSGSYSVMWYFGDGAVDSNLNPTHSYSNAGSYSVKLVVTSDLGCVSEDSMAVEVSPSPQAGYSFSAVDACFKGHQIDFQDQTTLAQGTYKVSLDWGDGKSDTTLTSSHTYTGAGNFYALLKATSSKGCADTIGRYIYIYPSPEAKFISNNTTQCFDNHEIEVRDSSYISAGSYTCNWNFGDGTTDTTRAVKHRYSQPGSFLTSLILQSDKGCTDSLSTSIKINYSPVAYGKISGGVQCLKGNQFDYYDSSSIAQGYISRIWNFGDGTQDTNAIALHHYTNPGNYVVQLIAVSDQGCQDTIADTISVIAHPIAKISLNSFAQCFRGNDFMAYDSTTFANGSYTRVWNYGDGYTDTASISSHSYAAPGSYSGLFVVTSSQGCGDTLQMNITVYDSPQAKLVSDTNSLCLKNNVVHFSDSSFIANGSLSSWIYFGDNDSSSIAPVSHSYAAAGSYNAYIITTSVNGCTDTADLSIHINENPQAAFSINNNSQCFIGNAFSLTNNATISSGPLTYTWNFGDGNSDTATAPVYIYSSDGNYTITLVAASASGCSDTLAKGVEVNPMPVAKWAVNNNTQCLRGNSFSFSDSSSVKNGSLKLNWDFGNGVTDSVSNPVIIYAGAQQYKVELTVTSVKGCISKAGGVVAVNASPVATITPNGSLNFCEGKDVVLKTATGYIYQWMKNNGNINGATDSIITVNASGDYKVVVASQNGCTDTSNALTVTVASKSNFGGINGAKVVSPMVPQSYNVPNVGGLTYTWSVTGGNIISGQGTSAIQVQWTNMGPGTLIVSADCYINDTLNVSIVGGITTRETLYTAEVYPNPTNDFIHVVLPENSSFHTIQLYDLNGKLMTIENVIGRRRFSIDMQSFSAGVYQLVVIGNDGSMRQKVVLNK